MKKIMTVAFVSVILQGCSTTVISPEQRLQTKAQLPKIEQSIAQVCFIRDSSLAPLWKPDVTEDGKNIGVIKHKSYFCHNTTAGVHKYVLSTALDYDREIDMKLNKDARSYIDYSISMGFLSGNGQLKEINEEEALNKIYKLKN